MPAYGRRIAKDERDTGFPLQALVPVTPPERTYRYWWDGGWNGDQGATPQCVAYAWLHFLEDGPFTRAPRAPGAGPVVQPRTVYDSAQLVDEWEGQNYDGTSVRAGAKVLQSLGYISEYRWGWTLADLIDAVLNVGPVVVGTWWYTDMETPTPEGFVRVEGFRVGGHAYVVNGVNTRRGVARIKNSWGTGWGLGGRAWIAFEGLERLIHEDGEVCLATEVPE